MNRVGAIRAISGARPLWQLTFDLLGRMCKRMHPTISNPNLDGLGRPHRKVRGFFVLVFVAAFDVLFTANLAALPRRLVLAIDGVSYRDMKALQQGVTYKDAKGKELHRQAFNEGYFPVSRNVSTFPSISDVAWTDIFGGQPLPGYQRTYFSAAANSLLSVNPIASSMEYERQMNCELEKGFLRAMSYASPLHIFKYEMRELGNNFLQSTNATGTYYAYLRSTDDAQHLSKDIFAVLCTLDEGLNELRRRYRACEGRELEVLILSDHGNNHASAGHRVEVSAFLKKAGYRISRSITSPKDVVLPTAGIESWVEIHNAPAGTESLVQLLWHLRGVDVVTARLPGETNRFVVVNSKGERATIDWNVEKNSFRYSPETGDPINYLPVVETLSRKNLLEADGFASANAWMTETLTHRYPLALERIARGHTQTTLNPATILISLDNDFVHASWLLKKGSELVKFGGTHGGLDDLNSNGILLSSFVPTVDTSTSRLAALFDGFPGLRDYHAQETGADWVRSEPPAPLHIGYEGLSRDKALLRIWTPSFTCFQSRCRVEIKVEKLPRFPPGSIRRGGPLAPGSLEQRLSLAAPISFPDKCPYERIYAFPSELKLEPQKLYRISGKIHAGTNHLSNFKLLFHTDSRGLPLPY
jgi:hypothetical protein